jgi:hypothetical protein
MPPADVSNRAPGCGPAERKWPSMIAGRSFLDFLRRFAEDSALTRRLRPSGIDVLNRGRGIRA